MAPATKACSPSAAAPGERRPTEAPTLTRALQTQGEIHGERLLLLGPVVHPRSARDLRAAGIQFLDAAGNAYLDFEGVLIGVRARRLDPHLAPHKHFPPEPGCTDQCRDEGCDDAQDGPDRLPVNGDPISASHGEPDEGQEPDRQQDHGPTDELFLVAEAVVLGSQKVAVGAHRPIPPSAHRPPRSSATAAGALATQAAPPSPTLVPEPSAGTSA